MFDIKKMMDMMKNVYQMQQQMQDELKGQVIEGAAGGGMVSVTMNGQFEVLRVQIDPSVMDDRAFLQDLIKAAMNDANQKARTLLVDKMKDISGQMGLPT